MNVCSKVTVAVLVIAGAVSAQLETQKLVAPEIGARLGASIDSQGDRLVVGVPGEEVAGLSNAGAVRTYVWDGLDWVLEQVVVPSNPVFLQSEGTSVAIDGDVLAVGSINIASASTDAGHVTVHRWNGTSWVEEQTLTASDGLDGDRFGDSVAVDGDVLVVGAPEKTGHHGDPDPDAGAAYVFRWTGTEWVEEQIIEALISSQLERFASALEVQGDMILASVPGWPNGQGRGKVSVHEWDGVEWTVTQQLEASDGNLNDVFASSMDLDGDRLVVGARGHNGPPDHPEDGAVYVFEWDGSQWSETDELLVSDPLYLDRLGHAVELEGDLIVASATKGFAGADTGSIWAFRWDGSEWSTAVPVTPSPIPTVFSTIGARLTLSGERLAATIRVDADSTGEVRAFLMNWDAVGTGLAGTSGTPVFRGSGDLVAASPISLELSSALAGSVSTLVVGFTEINAPFKGGVLVPSPDALFSGLPVDGTGSSQLASSFPAGLPSDTSLTLQHWIVDAAAVSGFSASNALRINTP